MFLRNRRGGNHLHMEWAFDMETAHDEYSLHISTVRSVMQRSIRPGFDIRTGTVPDSLHEPVAMVGMMSSTFSSFHFDLPLLANAQNHFPPIAGASWRNRLATAA